MPTKKKSTKKKIEEVAKPSLIAPGYHGVILSTEEMLSAIQILGLARDIFNQCAVDTKATGNESASLIYAARAELSMMLYKKLRDVARVGEPTSDMVH